MLKWILIGSFILNKAYEGYLKYLDNSYLEKEPPENVRDVYDKEEYKKWLSYEKEGGRVDLINDIVDSALVLIILIFNIHSFVFSLFAGFNIYLQYLFTLAVFTVISMIVSVPFDHYDTFVIEEKYGISRKHEYQADGFAAQEGYGTALIEALKKLSKDSLTDLNPHPLVVKMLYSHPTLSQRIDDIEKIETEAANGN